MVYELLESDKVLLFSKSLHQKNIKLFRRTLPQMLTLFACFIETYGDEIIPLKERLVDIQKIVVFDDLVCERNQTSIINYFNGRHRKYSLFYLTKINYKTLLRMPDFQKIDSIG